MTNAADGREDMILYGLEVRGQGRVGRTAGVERPTIVIQSLTIAGASANKNGEKCTYSEQGDSMSHGADPGILMTSSKLRLPGVRFISKSNLSFGQLN